MINEAVLLCGGKGTRLKPLTENIPKAMIEYKGIPLLQRQLNWLVKNGIKRIILAVGYMSDKIEEYVNNNICDAEIIISKEENSAGTAGALHLALKKIKSSRFLVANVDDLNDIEIKNLEKLGGNVICLARPRLPFGAVIVENDIVKKFEEKPLLEDVWVSMGVYVLEQKIKLPEKGSIEYDVFPNIKIHAYKHTGYWKTINAMKDLDD